MRKSVSILLAIFLVFATALPLYAMQAQVYTIQTEGGVINPYYVAITSIRASITMSGTTATCSASISQSGASANVKLVLQRSTNGGSTYSDFATLLNKKYTTKNIAAEASKSGLDTSYKYRTKVVVTVYDSAGKQIDSGTAYSS